MKQLLAWCGQPLIEHIERVGDIAAGREEAIKTVAEAVKAKLCRELDIELLERELYSTYAALAARLSIDNELVRRLAGVAGYFHDIGKAIGAYQSRFPSDKCGDCKGVSLAGHEVWSAWIAYFAVRESPDLKKEQSEVFARIIAMAVALHHSARRSIDDVVLDAVHVRPTLDDLDLMFELARAGLERYGLSFSQAAKAAARYHLLRFYDITALREKLLSTDPAPAELLVHVITTADNLDAVLNRCNGRIAYVLKPLLRGRRENAVKGPDPKAP